MATPARQQYLDIKAKHKDQILLFRMGDFYETFDEDAQILSRELEIALTSREMGKGKKIPLAGIPYHSLNNYLGKLIDRNYAVAICEQVSDPKLKKGIVDRKVVRVATPGTIVEDSLLSSESNNFLASIIFGEKYSGIAYIDLTTSEFYTSQIANSEITSEISRIDPKEIITSTPEHLIELLLYSNTITKIEHSFFDLKVSTEFLKSHFETQTLEPFGCENIPMASRAAGSIIQYIEKNYSASLRSITSLKTYSTGTIMALDNQTRRNLELFSSGRFESDKTSLFSTLNRTVTPMGGRLLKTMIASPLIDIELINERLSALEWFYENPIARSKIHESLKMVSDVERIGTKIRAFRASPRDLIALRTTLSVLPDLITALKPKDNESPSWITDLYNENSPIRDLIEKSIVDDPSVNIGSGNTIRTGYSAQLDQIKSESLGSQLFMSSLEKEEQNATGIKNLKINYNKVFGYFIEVTKSNLDLVPDHYIRKQTLVGAERYITPDMKEYEKNILVANEKIHELETVLFEDICRQIGFHIENLLILAKAISTTDVFCALAIVSTEHNYIKPEITDSNSIIIESGRHPIVEKIVGNNVYVPNDTVLSTEKSQIAIITGPNMSGKSTYLRQVGLISLMAQIGCYVPAKYASLGIVDRIFTRVGLQDDLTAGQSTFMVEMVETSTILNQATNKSLVILDEIGRGTSTYDGLAIAQSVAEHLHNHPKLRCKTLFATHYHEMTSLSDNLPRVQNFHVTVAEQNGNISFLHQIKPGKADKSYGIYVAKLAGIPSSVINRAWQLLHDLEAKDFPKQSINTMPTQLSFLNENSELLEKLRSLDIDTLTPIEAITKLYEFQSEHVTDHRSE